jgi:hypothetical protein
MQIYEYGVSRQLDAEQPKFRPARESEESPRV